MEIKQVRLGKTRRGFRRFAAECRYCYQKRRHGPENRSGPHRKQSASA